jgi:hypothetical protein
MDWQPIDTAPKDGFFLVHSDGAIRTMFRYQGEWSLPDIPVLVNEFGDHMVSREVYEAYGKTLEISGVIREPTHWQPLPSPPSDKP